MKVSSLKSYLEPSYPARSVLDEHPELLELVPVRWRANPIVIGALTGLCLMMSAYRSHAASAGAPPASRVAPVFQHGNGRASYGCVAVAAPVFLSEDEARQVIEDEARKAGISFTRDCKTLTIKANAQRTAYFMESEADGRGRRVSIRPSTSTTERTINLTLDGTSKKANISYEFVSDADFDTWRLVSSNIISTVSVRDYAKTAELLRDGLEKAKPQGAYGVFYDPVFYDTGNRGTNNPRAPKPTSADELRKQVQDFVEWLKAQGVI
ncbi:MAG: hypothetical protein Q7T82_06525 [Armatimonadota bacterium]|nr:hypothetical protein [Armatimonadota bacterium]